MKTPNRLHALRQYFESYSRDVHESLDFLEWYLAQTHDFGAPTIEWEEDVYRIVYGGYDPLSVEGTLAAGGRFNIGGAQVNHLFPNFSMQACLYAASTLECARKEAGKPLGNAQEYVLRPTVSFKLWDLKSLLSKLSYPHLKFLIDSTPLAAQWKIQKTPKVSQILASFLRKQGGDGLIYPSTKDRRGKVLTFFAKDTESIKKHFTVKRLEPVQKITG